MSYSLRQLIVLMDTIIYASRDPSCGREFRYAKWDIRGGEGSWMTRRPKHRFHCYSLMISVCHRSGPWLWASAVFHVAVNMNIKHNKLLECYMNLLFVYCRVLLSPGFFLYSFYARVLLVHKFKIINNRVRTWLNIVFCQRHPIYALIMPRYWGKNAFKPMSNCGPWFS